jgi:uncharacterized protein (TIGR01777 family)
MQFATHKPTVFLSGSATGYYGDAGDTLLDEATPPAADFGAALCVAWEQAALAATQQGIRVCLLRTGLVLDLAGGLIGGMIPAFKFGFGARLGNGQQWMSWIHRDDYVAMVLLLLVDSQARGPFNMTAPQPVTNKQFTATLSSVLKRSAPWVAPAWLLRLLLGQRAYFLLGGQRALPIKAEAQGYAFQFTELTGALQAILLK